MLALALFLATQVDPIAQGALTDVEAVDAMMFQLEHAELGYAAEIAEYCERAIQSGDVRKFIGADTAGRASTPALAAATDTDCAIYGYGRSAR